VVSAILGLSVSATAVRAVLVELRGGAVRWAGEAPYDGATDLSDAIARLAGEAGQTARRVRVALERDVVQVRVVSPAPPLKPAALRRYVALEAPRLFRKNGVPLVSDASRIVVDQSTSLLWAAATLEPIVQGVVTGCAQAGLRVEALGPAGTWQSRRTQEAEEELWGRWGPSLNTLGENAPRFAAAYGAAVSPAPLELLPAAERDARGRDARRHFRRVMAIAAAIWMAAGAVYAGRLFSTYARSTHLLDAVHSSVDIALSMRRELDAGEATLTTIATAEAGRSRRLALLGDLTNALRDSAYLVALRVDADGTVRLVGYAPSASRVLADLERVRELTAMKLEGPVTRESSMDRFSIVALLVER
jgi:hypothetical protein